MKPNICFTFKIHQSSQLRLYRFFDIGKDSHYYDDFANRSAMRKSASRSYLPMNELLMRLIKETKGKVKVNLAISGSALKAMDRYCPELLDSFSALSATGCVEFVSLPFYHSMAAIQNKDEFAHQIEKHKDLLKQYFGVEPTSFVNTDMVYSDEIGAMVNSLGFNTLLTEGSRQNLGWRSPDYVYKSVFAPKLKLLLRNPGLSDDISLRFEDRNWNEWPLDADKYYDWLCKAADGQVVNLCMNYKVFGEYHAVDTGIFNFIETLMRKIALGDVFNMATLSEASKCKAVDTLSVPDPISCEDEERDMSKWLGNELQQDAFNKLYSLREKIALSNLPQLWEDFGHLQESDHFYNMSTKFFSDAAPHRYINPYDTPYEAFINYMNVLSDFSIRVNEEINQE